MPQISCPACSRPLMIGDNLAGASVRCPGCKTVFQAPAAAPKAVPVAPPPAPAPIRAPAPVPAPPAASDSPFDFGGAAPQSAAAPAFAFDEPAGILSAGHLARRQARSAAAWLRAAVVFMILVPAISVASFMIVAAIHRAPPEALMLLAAIQLGIVALFLALPVTFMLLGANSLAKMRVYGLAVTGAVFASLTATGMSLFALYMIVGGAMIAFANPAPLLLGGPLTGTAAYVLVRATIKTITALANRDVLEGFRENALR